MEVRPSDLIRLKKDIERIRNAAHAPQSTPGKDSRAFRIEDGKSPIAAAFNRLHDPALFEAVRRYLADESSVLETETA
jgi:hypothetical protein